MGIEKLGECSTNQKFGVKRDGSCIVPECILPVGVNCHRFGVDRANGPVNKDFSYHQFAITVIGVDSRYICCNRPVSEPECTGPHIWANLG